MRSLDEHRNAKPPPRRSGEEPPPTQVAEVDKVVDVMMLELEEMEHRRQEAIKRQKGGRNLTLGTAALSLSRVCEKGVRARGHLSHRGLHRDRLAGAARLHSALALDGALRAKRGPLNLPLHSMITYATVAMLMSLILEVDGTRLIREKLREGTIATDLMKPISVPLYFFSDGLGQTVLHALLVIPSLLCALLLVHIDVPSAGDLRGLSAGLLHRLRRQLLS